MLRPTNVLRSKVIAVFLALAVQVSIIGTLGVGTLVLQGCFGDKDRVAAVRLALKGAPILINRLVSTGKITQMQADGPIKDFSDGLDVGLVLGQNLSDAKTPQHRYDAAKKAFDDWMAIYNRGNFGVHPDIRDAADIASGIFEFISAYYADKAGVTTHSDVGADGLSEDEFKDTLDQKIEDLTRAFKKE